jgi:hypothetical protein
VERTGKGKESGGDSGEGGKGEGRGGTGGEKRRRGMGWSYHFLKRAAAPAVDLC